VANCDAVKFCFQPHPGGPLSGSRHRIARYSGTIHNPENAVIDIVYIQPLVALVFGILILLLPRILNYLIAVYLIVVGVLGLWPHLLTHVTH
jgi:hypothetical protein